MTNHRCGSEPHGESDTEAVRQRLLSRSPNLVRRVTRFGSVLLAIHCALLAALPLPSDRVQLSM